jgi:hypothetical protein
MPRLSSEEPPEGTTASTRMTKADVLDLLDALPADRLLTIYRTLPLSDRPHGDLPLTRVEMLTLCRDLPLVALRRMAREILR